MSLLLQFKGLEKVKGKVIKVTIQFENKERIVVENIGTIEIKGRVGGTLKIDNNKI